MRRRSAKLPALVSLLRLMVVALALQLSGSTPALARVVEAASERLAPHACPCCPTMTARSAERIREQERPTVREAGRDCCGSGAAGSACGDCCTSCGSARDSKSFTSDEPLAVALAEPVARVAARSAAAPLPAFVHPSSIYRPPCA